MPLPESILTRLGVPHRRSLTDLSRLIGCDLAQVSRGDPLVARVCGYAADLLDGSATGTAEFTDGAAWARGVELARRIQEVDGWPVWSEQELRVALSRWGYSGEIAGALVDLGAERWHERGGWAEVRRRVGEVTRA